MKIIKKEFVVSLVVYYVNYVLISIGASFNYQDMNMGNLLPNAIFAPIGGGGLSSGTYLASTLFSRPDK